MTRPPNIVWIVLDHLAFRHHYGRMPGPRMPTYERLCREGVSFTRAQAVCPLCTPARASMLTGVYPHRHGLVSNRGDCGALKDFRPGARLFSAPLLEAGYRVGYFGKWHCGETRLPGDFGFEGWWMDNRYHHGYGSPYEAPEYAAYLDELGLPPARVDVEWDRWHGTFTGRDLPLKERSDLCYLLAAGVLRTPLETHESSFVVHLANRWIEQVASSHQPFCVRVDPWGPHHAYLPAAPFAGTVDPRSIPEYPSFRRSMEGRPQHHRAAYRCCAIERPHDWEDWQPAVARCYENVHMVDHVVGGVLEALERLGLTEDTLVVYTADHGDLLAAQGGFVDKIWVMAEETQRIPLVLRWPGRLPAGAAREVLASNMDLVPTVLEAAGAEPLTPCDGRSLLAAAQRPEAPGFPDDLMCQHHGTYRHAVFQRLLRWRQYKYVAHLGDQHELYDLERDPYEMNNCIEEPALRAVLAEMRRRLARRMQDSEDNAPDGLAIL